MNRAMFRGDNLVDLLQGAGATRAAFLVNLLLVLWIAHGLAGATWDLLPAPAPVRLPPPSAAAASGGQAAAPLAERLAAWHLFGTAAPAPGGTAAGPIDAPETHLNLVLHGVLSSNDAAAARAIIAGPKGDENYYRIGAMLPGGAELTAIYPDRVILRRNQRYETLRLPRDKAVETGAQVTPGGSAGVLLGRIRDEVAQNPRTLLDLVRPEPVMERGRFVGYRLHPGSNPGLLAQLGLHNGDIVTAINGVQLDNPATGIQALRQLSTADSVNLTVERNGRQLTMGFQVP